MKIRDAADEVVKAYDSEDVETLELACAKCMLQMMKLEASK